MRPPDTCDRRDQPPVQSRANLLQVAQSLFQAGFQHLQRRRWHSLSGLLLPLWSLSWCWVGVALAGACDHCLILPPWPWAERLWGPSRGCSPAGLAISPRCRTVGQLWCYVWKCPILPLLRNPPLITATALGILFMLLITDWLPQWSKASK